MSRVLAVLVALILPFTLTTPARAKDELVVAMTQYPATWNPVIGSMLAKSLIQSMTRRPFTAWDADWKLRCHLCVEVPTLENGRARRVTLEGGKEGLEVDLEIQPAARWGDGVPVSVRDVAFTLEVGKHPLSGVASAEGYRRILAMKPHDDKRFTLTFDRVTFDYSNIDLQLLPAHIDKPVFDADPAEYRNRNRFDTDSTNPGLAHGPYRFVQVVPGSQIVLERNPTWWGPTPHFRRIVVRIVESTAALEANLLSGSVDYVLGELGLTLDQGLLFEKRHGQRFDVVHKPALIYEHIDVNLDNPLLADRRVRQALLMAIDREAISRTLFEGRQPVAHGGVSPLDPMFSPAARQYRHDPAEARRLLDAAGFSELRAGVRHNAKGDRFSIELTTTAGNRVREQVAQVLQSQWRQVGVELRIRAEPPRVFSQGLNRRAFSGLAMYAWVTRPQGVPRSTLHSGEIPSEANGWTGQNYPAYRNAEMDRVLDAMERELDEGRRRALFAEMQRLHAEDLPVLPLFFRVDSFVIPKKLKGVVPTGHVNGSTLSVENWRWVD
ncbi:MAG: peptide ABC transporter substrate-binding protein [Alphaproteobacteria bacterium]|nr:peptide ABC transporter substrate-binding protein [Alphaproteobacteria bacterium]